MRRKPDSLIPLEVTIMQVVQALQERNRASVYGYQIASRIATLIPGTKGIYGGTKKGVVYRALKRLEKMGYLESQWEELPPGENRPRRKYYKFVKEGK